MITVESFIKASESCESMSGMYHDECGKKCYELAKDMAISFCWHIINHKIDYQPTIRDNIVIGLDMEKINLESLFELYIKYNHK